MLPLGKIKTCFGFAELIRILEFARNHFWHIRFREGHRMNKDNYK